MRCFLHVTSKYRNRISYHASFLLLLFVTHGVLNSANFSLFSSCSHSRAQWPRGQVWLEPHDYLEASWDVWVMCWPRACHSPCDDVQRVNGEQRTRFAFVQEMLESLPRTRFPDHRLGTQRHAHGNGRSINFLLTDFLFSFLYSTVLCHKALVLSLSSHISFLICVRMWSHATWHTRGTQSLEQSEGESNHLSFSFTLSQASASCITTQLPHRFNGRTS